ncbi:DUF2993 domain-containing protein [Streptomyces sp. NPDC085529]|uniref:DUF2993 domain-containing protein n=1 Tax=Streptomyces sp. NPDC085529 TaxID=3365729 RepID=UPI0037D56291
MYQPQPDDGRVGEPYRGDSLSMGSSAPRGWRLIVVAASMAAPAGGLAVDRIAAARAESRMAEVLQDGMGTADRPSVRVSGFPVLTQLAKGSLRRVDLTAHDIPANGSTRPLPVTTLTVRLDGLKTSGSADEAHADRVGATAFLSYGDVSGALGVRVSPGGEPGRIGVTAVLPVAGDVTVSAAVSAATGNRIAFTDVRTVPGELLPPLRTLLDRALDDPVPLENVPEGLHLRSVTTTRDGIDAAFTGRSIAFRRGSSSAG